MCNLSCMGGKEVEGVGKVGVVFSFTNVSRGSSEKDTWGLLTEYVNKCFLQDQILNETSFFGRNLQGGMLLDQIQRK